MCHSLDYIPMNSLFLDRKGWEGSVNKMIKVMGAPISERGRRRHRRLSRPQLRQIAPAHEDHVSGVRAADRRARRRRSRSCATCRTTRRSTSPRRSAACRRRATRSPRRSTPSSRPGRSRRWRAIPQRPYSLDYIQNIFTDFQELHGDRSLRRRSLDRRRAGALRRPDRDGDRPSEGPRHQGEAASATSACRGPRAIARRCGCMRLAEKFGIPVMTFVDTPGRVSRASAPRSAGSPRRSGAICMSWRSCGCRSS